MKSKGMDMEDPNILADEVEIEDLTRFVTKVATMARQSGLDRTSDAQFLKMLQDETASGFEKLGIRYDK